MVSCILCERTFSDELQFSLAISIVFSLSMAASTCRQTSFASRVVGR